MKARLSITLPTSVIIVYQHICTLSYATPKNSISPGNDMLSKMQSLFAEYPEVDLRALGFYPIIYLYITEIQYIILFLYEYK